MAFKSIVYRTCEVSDGFNISICELRRDESNNFFVNVISDSKDLFVDFDFSQMKKTDKKMIIKIFEKDCLNRFTCNNQFSVNSIKKEQGEEIKFY